MTKFEIVFTTVIGLMGALSARAQISTGFESSQGYSPTGGVLHNGTTVTGTVVGQPSGGGHTWFTYTGDNRHAFLVGEGVGYGGTQGLISQQVIGNALWNPTTGVLDGVQTEFQFGFKFRFIDPPFRNGEELDGFLGFRLDDTNANGSHFEVYLNAGEGRVRPTSRTSAGEWLNVRLVDAQNQPFAAQQNVWYEVWGNGSYATDTYSVYVREAGNATATLYKQENLPFRYHGLGTGPITPGPWEQNDDIVRLHQAKTDSALYCQIALEDGFLSRDSGTGGSNAGAGRSGRGCRHSEASQATSPQCEEIAREGNAIEVEATALVADRRNRCSGFLRHSAGPRRAACARRGIGKRRLSGGAG